MRYICTLDGTSQKIILMRHFFFIFILHIQTHTLMCMYKHIHCCIQLYIYSQKFLLCDSRKKKLNKTKRCFETISTNFPCKSHINVQKSIKIISNFTDSIFKTYQSSSFLYERIFFHNNLNKFKATLILFVKKSC